MRSIVDQVRPDRQTLLFSATFKRRVEQLAAAVLKDPIRIQVGRLGQSNEHVKQEVEVLGGDGDKWQWLTARMRDLVAMGKLLVFVSSKSGAEELATNLNKFAHAGAVVCLHGDMDQTDRHEKLRRFRMGEAATLVATDVAARGLDIKGVANVVNFDVAKNIEQHVHRIGRTGRMGHGGVDGTAYTLVTHREKDFAASLVVNLRMSRQAVPPNLEALARTSQRWAGGGRGSGGGGGGGGGRAKGAGAAIPPPPSLAPGGSFPPGKGPTAVLPPPVMSAANVASANAIQPSAGSGLSHGLRTGTGARIPAEKINTSLSGSGPEGGESTGSGKRRRSRWDT